MIEKRKRFSWFLAKSQTMGTDRRTITHGHDRGFDFVQHIAYRTVDAGHNVLNPKRLFCGFVGLGLK
jgi:hypothetical protein